MDSLKNISLQKIHMTKSRLQLIWFYDRIVLKRPWFVILIILAVLAFLGYRAKDFRLDASAETLVLDNDEDLRYLRVINSRYGEADFLVIAYTPKEDLFSPETLANIKKLQNELSSLDRVSSVVSILELPLIESPPVPIKELASTIMTLESPGIDMDLAALEFQSSPVYKNLLVSQDLKTTALQIRFFDDEVYHNLLTRRNNLREIMAGKNFTAADENELRDVSEQFQKHRDMMKSIWHHDVSTIRAIMDKYRQDADLFLGGVNMIADDMISFIKNDLKLFGIGVLFFLIVTLKIIFKELRWIVLPLLCCGFSAVAMMGLLGMFGWEVTVISSNFISLQLIITMAISIHLIVRFRELHALNPEAGHKQNVLDTACLMLRPCVYAALTTIAGFGSLVLSDILPVINFGWMMIGGVSVSLILTFLFFPAGLMLFKKDRQVPTEGLQLSLSLVLARFTEKHGSLIIIVCCIALVLSVIGISRLHVENAFINYFKKSTEIYQGMKVIDQNLGGTTPLDVVVDFENPENSDQIAEPETPSEFDDEFDEFDEFDEAEDDDKYWFTSDKIARIVEIHDYLDNLPETGKVLSLGAMMKLAEKLNDGLPLDNFQLALLFGSIPEAYKKIILKPFVSIENDQVRFSVRIKDSEESLRRNELLNRIQSDLVNKLGLKEDHFRLTGMLVLYNNMLQSLFNSQIRTLGTVVFVLICMFLVLFRSLKIALIAIFPNLMSIGVVLGFMGWMNIPLDMMTITIAAISVGIAVDDTIHYIHRFELEFAKDGNYINAVYRCHGSIGYAMYYTTLTIIIGFSILVLSNFIPSIYFGLLTGLAMFIALIAALTLLPQLLIFFKPYGENVEVITDSGKM